MGEELNSVIQTAELVIIKRDFDMLKKLVPQLPNEVQTQLTPYIALFCHEVLEYLEKRGYGIELESTSSYSIKDIRQKTKFFDLSLKKLFQCVENVDRLQNEYFIGLMKFPWFGRWNVHYNLGIYFDVQGNIVSNTQYAYYVFQDDKTISKSEEDIHGRNLIDQEIRNFGYDMGVIIGNISDGLSTLKDFISSDISANKIVLNSQDYNTNRCSCFKNKEYKTIRLFLLHVLSSLGLVIHVLKKMIIRDNGFLLRFEYITYHYVIRRLYDLTKHCNEHADNLEDGRLIDLLNSIDYQNVNGLRNTVTRNCMMHFGLTNLDGTSCINEESFDLAQPFCGLIESQFSMSYDEYKSKLETELLNIYRKIQEYLSIDFQPKA